MLLHELNKETAETLVGKLSTMRSNAYLEEGKKQAAIGAAWCIVGIAITFITLAAAQSVRNLRSDLESNYIRRYPNVPQPYHDGKKEINQPHSIRLPPVPRYGRT